MYQSDIIAKAGYQSYPFRLSSAYAAIASTTDRGTMAWVVAVYGTIKFNPYSSTDISEDQ